MRSFSIPILAFLFALVVQSRSSAALISLSNGSFESPETPFADPRMDVWQKAPQPIWYTDPQFPWEQLMGQFLNPTNGAPGHIENLRGKQAAFIFALPQTAVSREETTLYAAGRSYRLTVGLQGGGGGMSNGTPFMIRLFYTDDTTNRVTVAATIATNSTALFPDNRRFVDFTAESPSLAGSHAAVGRKIGIELMSLAGFDQIGGYWNVDDVRLEQSDSIAVANGSFESPETAFADPRMDLWQKAPQPIWYTDPQFPWDQLMGQFLNPTNGSPGHIENTDRKQAAFIFALPTAGISQELDARFENAVRYQLTAALQGGGGGMSNGTPFLIRLFYTDDTTNRVTVAATIVTNSPDLFPDNRLFKDFTAATSSDVPAAAVGRRIGIELQSIAGFNQIGGYWNVDHVRLNAVAAGTPPQGPQLANARIVEGRFQAVVRGPGKIEVLASASPGVSGVIVETFSLTDSSPEAVFSEALKAGENRFFRARKTE